MATRGGDLKRAITLIFGVVISASAVSQDWQYVGASSELVFSAQRVQGAQFGANDLRFWVRAVPKDLKRPPRVTPRDPKSPTYVEGKQFTRILCSERQIATISTVYYDKSGGVASNVVGDEFMLTPIVPESLGDKLHRMFCGVPVELGR
jgi:hypothetical protein